MSDYRKIYEAMLADATADKIDAEKRIKKATDILAALNSNDVPKWYKVKVYDGDTEFNVRVHSKNEEIAKLKAIEYVSNKYGTSSWRVTDIKLINVK